MRVSSRTYAGVQDKRSYPPPTRMCLQSIVQKKGGDYLPSFFRLPRPMSTMNVLLCFPVLSQFLFYFHFYFLQLINNLFNLTRFKNTLFRNKKKSLGSFHSAIELHPHEARILRGKHDSGKDFPNTKAPVGETGNT